ncbi:DNA-binding transcriptional regulator, AcrR family [Nonomuraea solani]|uniref:DNA-binding transcriptional regulator, AcrR family n=1 Tax=Nonomuraea solani TaxID=1144553 RepID=A0A1H6EW38_9ACTN|nr:TetR/AcrR family transcriptional regulator [Nonomuraea solani]SEH01246.1 DNA-binding transcriptional regulator, AcrR family [Nonomuraea solani]
MNDKLLRALWEPAAPREGLSLPAIARAAVELADAGGLEAVSMARVAERLGFTTMSLYRHVKSKQEVLLLMLDAVAPVPAELDEPCDGWRPGLERWCRAQWEMLRAHTWIVHLPVSGPPITPNQLAWTDRALAVLRGTGLSESDKAGVVLLVASHMLTAARMSVELGRAASGESIAAYTTLLGDLVDERRLPALRTALDAGAFGYPAGIAEEERRFDYSFGLARVLDGVAALIGDRRG